MSDTQDDFNPKKAFEDLSANINQPDKFAQLFCEAAKKQKSIDDVLKSNIRELISHDKDTIEIIKKLQREVDKEDWKIFVKKIGVGGWAILLIVIGAILQTLLKKYL